jgi:hypothetical protein
MLKLTKYFLVLCLITLQLVAPFIHAHAFGHDSFKTHAFHVHATELADAKNEIHQAQLYDHVIIGAITMVASGIKTSAADDIADDIVAMAVFFILALLVFNISARLVWQAIHALRSQRYFYALQNPRAPPF